MARLVFVPAVHDALLKAGQLDIFGDVQQTGKRQPGDVRKQVKPPQATTPDMFAAAEAGGLEKLQAEHGAWHGKAGVAETAHHMPTLLRDLERVRKPGVVKPESEQKVLDHLAHVRTHHPEMAQGHKWETTPVSGKVAAPKPEGPGPTNRGGQGGLFFGVEGQGGQQAMFTAGQGQQGPKPAAAGPSALAEGKAPDTAVKHPQLAHVERKYGAQKVADILAGKHSQADVETLQDELDRLQIRAQNPHGFSAPPVGFPHKEGIGPKELARRGDKIGHVEAYHDLRRGVPHPDDKISLRSGSDLNNALLSGQFERVGDDGKSHMVGVRIGAKGAPDVLYIPRATLAQIESVAQKPAPEAKPAAPGPVKLYESASKRAGTTTSKAGMAGKPTNPHVVEVGIPSRNDPDAESFWHLPRAVVDHFSSKGQDQAPAERTEAAPLALHHPPATTAQKRQVAQGQKQRGGGQLGMDFSLRLAALRKGMAPETFRAALGRARDILRGDDITFPASNPGVPHVRVNHRDAPGGSFHAPIPDDILHGLAEGKHEAGGHLYTWRQGLKPPNPAAAASKPALQKGAVGRPSGRGSRRVLDAGGGAALNDWKHGMEGLSHDEHDAHFGSHLRELKQMRQIKERGGGGADLPGRMSALAVHADQHRQAMGVRTREKVGWGIGQVAQLVKAQFGRRR